MDNVEYYLARNGRSHAQRQLQDHERFADDVAVWVARLSEVTLWHITSKDAWDRAKTTGVYRPAAFEAEGFIHLSTARQWLRTANRYYRGQGNLVRLAIDETRLDAELRFEPAHGDLFPHLYGPLPVAAVTAVVALVAGPDGAFVGHVPAAHAAVVERAVAYLSADPRWLGLAAAGSWLHGMMDEHSDIDLVALAAPAARDTLFAERAELLDSLGRVLVAFTGEHVGEPRLTIALFGAPLLHVDVKLVVPAELEGQADTMQVLWERDGAMSAALAGARPQSAVAPWQWIEDRFWVWVHYGATKIARGEYFEALDHLGFLRVHALGPLGSLARGEPPRGVRFVERDRPLLAEQLRRTVATLDAADLGRALGEAVEIYRALRGHAPGQLRHHLEAERAAVAFLTNVR